MRSTSLILVALAVVVGACSSDSGKPVDPSRLGVRIVSGDRQVAPVAAASGASQVVLPAGISAQALPDNLLPEPLVARITVDGQPLKSISVPTDPLGPSLAVLPSDLVVTYRVIRPEGLHTSDPRHCGASFVDAARPKEDGTVTTYWERGTYAGECRMEVRLVVDGQPRVDTAFVVEFEPGAVWSAAFHGAIVTEGGSVDLAAALYRAVDRHGNEVDPVDVRARATPEWKVVVPPLNFANRPNWNRAESVVATGTGWTIPAPPIREKFSPPEWPDFRDEPMYSIQVSIEGGSGVMGHLTVVPAGN